MVAGFYDLKEIGLFLIIVYLPKKLGLGADKPSVD
jgi:hypothetical protein